MCVQTTNLVIFTNELHVIQRQMLSLYATDYNTQKMNEQNSGGRKTDE